MSTGSPSVPISPMHRPTPSLVSHLPKAISLAFFWALGISLLQYGIRGLTGERGLANETSAALSLAALVFPLVLAISLVWLHRPLQDRVFVWVGFASTFLGLGMLLWFFWNLGEKVNEYFHLAPTMVEQRNQDLQALKVKARALEQMKAEKSEAILREMTLEIAAAKDKAERKKLEQEYRTEILPRALRDLDATARELIDVAERGIRDDVSKTALLTHFLSHGPSNVPQDAGVFPAILGSAWIALITLLFAVPVGVGAAIYLEEYRVGGSTFAKFMANLIQININNLAGVPSVVYGILGAYVFVELIFKPLEHRFPDHIAARNVLGGGLTLGLLTLPVIIVTAQEAIRAVPASIRQGAYALGATRWQTIWYQVLPMASPGILTGVILALSRAIGEAAPLILFGALLFVNQNPELFSRFTILPMQIFGWADRPAVEFAGQSVEIWQANAALASVVLLVLLLGMNAFAIYFRNRAQRKMRV